MTEADRALLAVWISREPDHRGVVTPDMFIAPQPELETDPEKRALLEKKVQLYHDCMFCDELGEVLAVRFSTAMRIGVQFNPWEKMRTAKMMLPAMAWLIEQARTANMTEVIFESVTPSLISFCEKRLGFMKSPNEVVCKFCPECGQVHGPKGCKLTR